VSIRFGTDGWRALIAEDFTFANVRLCAEALARDLAATGAARRGVVVGYDTRFASDRFAAAVAEVLAAHDVRVWLCDGPAPTPAVSYAVTSHSAGGGVVITASHNPAAWNGFKVKSADGGSSPPEDVARLEEQIAGVVETGAEIARTPLDEAVAGGTVETFDAITPYLEQLGRVVNLEPILAADIRVAADAMYGAGAGLMPRLFAGSSVRVAELNGRINPAFPGIGQPEPVATNLERLMTTVPEVGADVGLALDGDADRLGVVDENGRYLTTLEVFSLLTHHLLARRGVRAAVCCTITMSAMVEKLGAHFGVPVHRTEVGFKYVGPKMLETDAILGGEESGGYAMRGHVPERDGLLSALLFLDAMVASGKKPSELLAALHDLVGPHAFDRIDLEFPDSERHAIAARLTGAEPGELAGLPVDSVDRRDGVRFVLEGGRWAIARLSGTEPLVRLYAEAEDRGRVDALLGDLRTLLGV